MRHSAVEVLHVGRVGELRIEVDDDAPLRLRLLSGKADVFGYELPQGIWLSFPPAFNFSVFGWYESTIEMDVAAAKRFLNLAREPAIQQHLNVHINLETARYIAFDESECQGPRVVVVGPTDSGKSTLSRTLVNWATGWACYRPGRWKPTLVDLDVSQGSITLPGCIAAATLENPIHPVVQGFPLQTSSLAYFYGHVTPRDNVELYKVLVNELAGKLERQFAENDEFRAAGMVVNTMACTDQGGVGYDLLLHAIRTFKANTVLVLGQEKLCNLLREVLVGEPKVVVRDLPTLGGVVSRNLEFRQKASSYKIREYLYGLADELSPHSNIANFGDLSVYRAVDPTSVVPVNINGDLLNLVLAVSLAKEPDDIISSKVAGFIYVTDIDNERKKITYLTPLTELPSKYLIMGSLACGHMPLIHH